MSSFRDLKFFYGLFYVFGQAPYFPHCDRNKIKSKILMFLPFFVLIANVAWCLLLFLLSWLDINLIKESNRAVLYIIKLFGFVPNFFVIYVNLFESFDVWCFNEKIFFMCDFLKVKLKATFRLNKFKSELYRDLIVSIAVIVITQISRFAMLTIYEKSIEIVLFIMQTYKTMAILHAVFYVKYFKFILISLNDEVEGNFFESVVLRSDFQRLNQQSIDYFERIRFIHFKLCEVMQIFSTRCGWSLIAIILESIATATSGIYGIFFFMVEFEDFPYCIVIRKYLLLLLLLYHFTHFIYKTDLFFTWN